jgi:two-component sensor histidine kinase
VLLAPKQAQNFSLVIHELATNAAKHGALSATEGRIVIRWALNEQGVVTFQWQERGGPKVSTPHDRGSEQL